MLKFISSMLCTSRIHPFSLGNQLRTSLIIGNLMIIKVISVEWTWLGLEWPLAQYVALYMGELVSMHSLAFLQSPIQISTISNSILHYSRLVSLQSCFLIRVVNVSSPKHSVKFFCSVAGLNCKHFNLLPSSINSDHRIHSFSSPYIKNEQDLCC